MTPLAMNEFGATFRRVSEVGSRKWMDAPPPASVSRLPARATSRAASRHAGACADDNDVVWMWWVMRGHHRPVAT
ncbi:hypothetical protein SAMN05443248_3756 [Bradyrhizobium erythrophlei]|uniref:Uncharacterized protein n=1 Tax=Bradyrhizobium erythrophlei TaxID=1437360 RepID=A0A1M5QD92_9BRAD|nr:hypothetical protein SAMN05443248_3756 [Bradyrhizobium erythrophlei]